MAALLIGDAGFNSLFGEALAFFLDRSHFGNQVNNEIELTSSTRTRFEAFIAEEMPELVQVMSRLSEVCIRLDLGAYMYLYSLWCYKRSELETY